MAAPDPAEAELLLMSPGSAPVTEEQRAYWRTPEGRAEGDNGMKRQAVRAAAEERLCR